MKLHVLTLAALLAFSGFASSQVVVTITSTLTITPPTTSTVTKVVTVTQGGSTFTSTSTSIGKPWWRTTITVVTTVSQTATATHTLTSDPNTTKCPIPLYYQCGGTDWSNGCNKGCDHGATCSSMNEYYSQCAFPTDAAASLASAM